MDAEPPPRVRVTGPHTERTRRGPRPSVASEIDAQSDLGAIYVSGLLRAQMRLALRTLLGLGLTIGILPLVFHLAPGLGKHHLLGMPVPWVVLAFACYPVLVLLAWRYVRAAERHEAEFVAVVERPGVERW
ncbi:MAG: hypothetical protein NTV23_07450 [Propionibacteriales bacterium]|nr:hypothetical protein [Propionibacteriales bacterium]